MNWEDMTPEEKSAFATRMAAPLSRRLNWNLQGKILLYSMGKEVDISEEEWKQAEELGWVEPL